MKRNDFIKSVNLYKLSDTVLQEGYIKQHLYIRRMQETSEDVRAAAYMEASMQNIDKK
jgi:hypothetical protein